MTSKTVTTQTEFLDTLTRVSSAYSWEYVDNGIIGVARRGQHKGKTFNPVTAVAGSLGSGYFKNTKRGTERAARAIGITPQLAMAVYSGSNRGHAQIVRGKILETVF